jgi:hypothetical protein
MSGAYVERTSYYPAYLVRRARGESRRITSTNHIRHTATAHATGPATPSRQRATMQHIAHLQYRMPYRYSVSAVALSGSSLQIQQYPYHDSFSYSGQPSVWNMSESDETRARGVVCFCMSYQVLTATLRACSAEEMTA